MSPDKITRMANQIATFFATQPDADKAGRVADHLKEFWEPRMLDQLADHLKNGGDGLSPLALDGCKRVLELPA
ncbi:formate dehydrogenase subunit delta [Octadecabacter sp. G9-8]|uniref:Formate dehydrogenase subunit delta n=1 Tax=Octadecabacter dasysiphoniae TaxID=2909341 RepID=A0ABS9CT28_9RHOB|nr:formate dehydrogenase subunit delta [Octadecabacter dasysiphoniae]MCF2870366.1 formate dehydrogenase subunit delta [Octadecabacter dasysiphoniae]